jgi:hypothetical protein
MMPAEEFQCSKGDHRPGAWVGGGLSFYELGVKTFYEVLRKYNVSEPLSGWPSAQHTTPSDFLCVFVD